MTQAIVSAEYAEALARTGYEIKCQFAIETGMNRIGIPSYDAKEAARIVRKYSRMLCVNGIFTHLCVADSYKKEDIEYTKRQLILFKNVGE